MMHAIEMKHSRERTFFAGRAGFVMGGKMLNRTPEVVAPSEFRSEGSNEKVRQLLLQNRHLSLRMIGYLRTTFYSLKSNPTLRDTVSTPFQTSITWRDNQVHSGSQVLRRHSEANRYMELGGVCVESYGIIKLFSWDSNFFFMNLVLKLCRRAVYKVLYQFPISSLNASCMPMSTGFKMRHVRFLFLL